MSNDWLGITVTVMNINTGLILKGIVQEWGAPEIGDDPKKDYGFMRIIASPPDDYEVIVGFKNWEILDKE